MRRSLVHTVELNEKEFAAARAVIPHVELQSVCITRSRFTSEVSRALVATMELATSSRTQESVANGSLTLLLDLALRGFKEECLLLDISARIEAVYSVTQESSFSPYQLKCFAKANGMLNVWPYWRDFVQSSVTRADLPPLTLPLFRVLHTRKAARILESAHQAPKELPKEKAE